MKTYKNELTEHYRHLHQSDKGYGATGMTHHWPYLEALLALYAPKTVLDYGCGKGTVFKALAERGYDAVGYDPSMPEYAVKPEKQADLVVNTDVLEHIPEDILDGVISDIAQSGRVGFIAIHMKLSKAVLPDGTNAHCTRHPGPWWQERLAKHFTHVVPLPHASKDHCMFVVADQPLGFEKELVARVKKAVLLQKWQRFKSQKKKLMKKVFARLALKSAA